MMNARAVRIACLSLIAVLLLGMSMFYACRMPDYFDGTFHVPDENMRFDLSDWIARNGRLPVGDEPELVSQAYGFSYALTPYFPTMLSGLMEQLIPSSGPLLTKLQLARIVSCVSWVLMMCYAFLLGNELFGGVAAWCFSLCAAFLPQAFFCALYMNNDITSLMSCFMIAYCLVSGKRKGWSMGSRVHLSVALAVCILTYYFAYAWVLASIAFCLWDFNRSLPREKRAGAFLTITLMVFALAGWFFIRNAILHQGDFLGLSSQLKNASALAAQGRNIFSLAPRPFTFDNFAEFVHYVFCSFYGVFGPMTVMLRYRYYFCFLLWLLVGFIPGTVSAIRKKFIFPLILLFSVILVTIAFAVFYSFRRDWSPQGRYIFAAWPALLILTTRGYLAIGDRLSRALPEHLRKAAGLVPVISASLCFLTLSAFAIIRYLLPLLNLG